MVVLLPGKAIGDQAKALWAAYKKLRSSKPVTLSQLSVEHKVCLVDLERVLKACKFQSAGTIGPAFEITDKGSVRLSQKLKTAATGGGAK